MAKSKVLLYINDYANDISFIEKCHLGEYPAHHLWGIDALSEEFDVRFCNLRKFKLGSKISLLLNNLLIFLKYGGG